MAIGAQVLAKKPEQLVAKALSDAARMPDFLLEARHIANNLMTGWHGRRKRGSGESFWQFRPYVEGEPVSHIDWRRSAKDDHTYLRDREWEAAQTVWFCVDQSLSLNYRSKFTTVSKGERALLLAFTLADILARQGERIAMPALLPATMSRHVVELMAMALAQTTQHSALPDFSSISRFSHAIIISDFLDDPNTIQKQLAILAQKQVSAHLIEVADPAEELFPYKGRTEFLDPETGEKYLAGRAEEFRKAYQNLYITRRDALRGYATRQGWSYHLSKTDEPMTHVILSLGQSLGQASGYRRG